MVVPCASDFRELRAALRSFHAAIPDPGVRFLALQQVCTDFYDGDLQQLAGFNDGASGRHHGTRRIGAGPGGRARGIAETDGHFARIDTENLVCKLGKYRLVSLPVRMGADFQNQLAVAGQTRNGRLHAGNELDPPGGIAERPRSVCGLLIEGRKADADQAPIRLGLFLPRADGRQPYQLSGTLERGAIIAAVQCFFGDGDVRHLRRLHEVAQARFERIDADGVRDGIHHNLMAAAR
jgi:hypothetical protein